MKYKKFAFPFLSIMIRTNLSFVLKAISLKPVLLPFKLNLWARGPVVSSYFFLFVFAQTCFAQTTISALPGLEVGDGAPGLKVEKWIKGGGFNSLSKGKIYVIDLWATWCVPCIASMPHLSRLQAMYKDKGVEVIGITSVDKYGNTLPKIEDFVHRRDSVMQYNVALVPVSVNEDGLQGIFVYPWMQQIGSMNLPTAFVVDRDGKVAYIGDPHTIDKPLEEMVNNEYDMRVAIANYRSGAHAAALLPELDIALKTNNVKEAISIGKQVLYNFSYVKPNTYLVLSSSITGTKTTNDELLEIALIAAKRGVASTQFESPGFYDLLATAYAAKGDYIMAAATEKMAIIYSEGEMKESQMKKFSNYQSLIRE